MRLKKLYIYNYKNLKNLTIDFESGEGLTILTGKNGSGKSNVIEFISSIFYDVHRNSGMKTESNYSLEYAFDEDICSIEKISGRRTFRKNNKVISREKFITDGCVPSQVIGIYSGEESRLWTEFYEPHYKSYIYAAINGMPTSGMRLFFINKHHWNIALLVLLLSKNETLVPFIKDVLHIDIETVKVTFMHNRYSINSCPNMTLKAFLERFNHKSIYTLTELRNEIYCNKQSGKDGEIQLVENGMLDSEVFLGFLQAFMHKKDKLIFHIKIEFNGISTELLSEGEKKLLLVKAVLEFLADEKTLLLFDEPDAYINESKKKTLYDMFQEYNNRQIVVSTHSPTLVDMANKNEIVMLRTKKNGNTEIFHGDKLEKIRCLTGSRFNAFFEKPILYCEGKENSVENQLYPLLFPNYLVIPCGGHEQVINNTRVYNKIFSNDKCKAIGIIDWDYKSEKQLQSLEDDGIFALRVLEVENILMDIELINRAKEQFLSKEDSIENVIKKIINDCNKEKEKQATKHTSSYIVSEIKSSLISEKRDIANFKTNVSRICDTTKIDEIYSERLSCLENIIKTNNYKELYKIYDFNHNIERFVKDDVVNDYLNRIIRLISKSQDIRNYIKKTYFDFIPDYR